MSEKQTDVLESAEAKAEEKHETKNKTLDMIRGTGPTPDSLDIIAGKIEGPKEEQKQPQLTEREKELYDRAFESHQKLSELKNQMTDLEKSQVESQLSNESHLYKHYDFGIQYALKNDKEATVEGLKAIDDYIERAISEGIRARDKHKEDAEKQAEREAKEEFKREVETHILKQHQPVTNSLSMIQALHAGEGYVPPKTPMLDNGIDRRMTSLEIIQAQIAKQYQ